jgi:hypothetical protein
MEYLLETKAYIRNAENRIAETKVLLRESAMRLKDNPEDETEKWFKAELRDQLNTNEHFLQYLIKERLALKDYYGV